MALVARNALKGGRRSALLTSVGIVNGLLVWTAASAVGVAFLIAANAFAFEILKLAGAAYLGYLGMRTLVSNWRDSSTRPVLPDNPLPKLQVKSPYAQGLLNNLLNPKIAFFFTSLIPQFITQGASVTLDAAELAIIFAVMGLAWLTAFALLVSKSKVLLRIPSVKKWLDTLTGAVLIGLGVKLAMESR